MSTEYVTLGTRSAGAGDSAVPGEPVEVPLDGLRGARGLVAGEPDAGIEDAPSAMAEQLHAAGQSVLLVDPDSSQAEFARHHDVRTVGDARDSDLRVTSANADRVVTVAAEGEASVVLDCESFGPEGDAGEALGQIATALARARRDRLSLVVVLANAHEWLPDAGHSACEDAIRELGHQSTPGIGVIAVTDRPGALDSGFRRECDWIAAHRVSWREHVDAVSRILGRGYEDDLEVLEDGEAFLRAPWMQAIERVRFEPPEREAGPRGGNRARSARSSPEQPENRARSQEQRASAPDISAELAEIRDGLDDLEAAVADLQDPTDVVDEMVDAIVDRFDGRPVPTTEARSNGTETGARDSETGTTAGPDRQHDASRGKLVESTDSDGGFGDVFDAFAEAGEASSPGTAAASDTRASTDDKSGDRRIPTAAEEGTSEDGGGMSFEPMNFAFDEGATGGAANPVDVDERRSRRSGERRVPRYVRDVVRTVEEMDGTTRKMLAHYVDRGADTPLNAHFSAGGSGDRTAAYAHNRQLRTTGFVEHVGRGHYSPTIPDKIRKMADHELSTDEVSSAVEHVRRALP